MQLSQNYNIKSRFYNKRLRQDLGTSIQQRLQRFPTQLSGDDTSREMLKEICFPALH